MEKEKKKRTLSKAWFLSMEGNTYRTALKDPEIRQEAYESYCEHISKGLSRRTWSFKKHGCKCGPETMSKYIKDEKEFDPVHIEVAMAEGQAIWERRVIESALGTNKNANTASLQMFMRNTYGWDKPEKDDKEEDKKKSAEGLLKLSLIHI